VRAVACLGIVLLSLGLAGCSLFSKKSQTKQDAPPPPAPLAPDWSRSSTDKTTGTPTGLGGILAGQVRDSLDRPAPKTYIQVVPAGAAGAKSTPLEVETVGGCFTIYNLQPGQHYQLIARTREGEAKMAGTIWATPPNARLLIYMREDFATANVPPAPNEPTVPGQRKSGAADQNGTTAANENKPNGADIGKPIKINDGNPPASSIPGQPQAEIRPESITQGEGFARLDPPVASIPTQIDTRPSPPPVAATPYAAGIPAVSTQVPSCVLTGRQLDNFALYDADGKAWEFRRDHRGKLVLLEFWGTWCPPCVASIPHMKVLQERYGKAGLEVIGIEYETDGTAQDQIRRVQAMRSLKQISYRLLLGGDIDSCPVKTQFGVTKFPTIVLLDENNRIVKSWVGLEGNKLQELEMLIRERLHVQY
jgi:thiol-disulfide isomerase/thioredoxin